MIKVHRLLIVSLFCFLFQHPLFSQKGNSQYVNLFIGTSGDHGQVDPGAGVPYGMVRVCPDSDPRSHAGYDYSVDKISGISVNRISGVGCGGVGGNLSIKPAQRSEDIFIDKESEEAIPGFYQTSFKNGVKAQLTANQNVAIEQYWFDKKEEAILTINFGSSFERIKNESHRFINEYEIEGVIESPNVCGHGRYKLYYQIKTNEPFKVKSGEEHVAELRFDNQDGQPVEVRIALSSVDMASAKAENDAIELKSFDDIRKEAIQSWDEKLGKIQVDGGIEEDKIIFYTSLYRTFLTPVNVTSKDGRYLGTDGKIHQAEGMTYYSSWSLWDTYRTKFPLLALLDPEVMSDISQSLVKLYQTGKKDWSTDFEAAPTVRTEHAMILLLDAFLKGIENINFRDCYSQMCQEVERLSLNSPDHKLEAVCDLWALSKIAGIIGETGDEAKYKKQSEQLFQETWKKEFMNIDSTYTKMRNNGLYQGTRWQYRWAVPQYINMMADCVGGKEVLLQQLNTFFEESLYNQGNEPDIHVPYIFNALGKPSKTQACVYSIMKEEILHKYGGNAAYPTPYFGRAYKNDPVGYSPEMDEDDGTMGAWYVFGATGLYPMIVGNPVYEMIPPLFDKVTLKLNNGKEFIIKTKKRKHPKEAPKSIRLNGKKYDSWQIDHQTIIDGGKLEYFF